MYVDLIKLKEELNITRKELSDVLDVSLNTLIKWEKQTQAPAKYYYKLHLKYPKAVPLPIDFFDYAPFIIRINMYIYGVTQKDIADELNIFQNNVHRMLFQSNNSLYDYKETLDKFFPVIYIPCERNNKGKYEDFRKGENFKILLTEKM